MAKQTWRAGNMLYPLPAVMVSCANEAGESDIVTVAWTGTVCTNPPMLYISLRPERFSYHIIRESGEFVVNLTTRDLQRACDWCGARSGRDFDKWTECELTAASAAKLGLAPVIEQSPVNIECRVVEVKELGSHHMFLAAVEAVQVDEELLDARGRLDLRAAGLTAYSHGEYFDLGESLGTFGYSVRKKPAAEKAGRAAAAGRGGEKPAAGRAGEKPAAAGRGGEKPAGAKKPVSAKKKPAARKATGSKASSQLKGRTGAGAGASPKPRTKRPKR